MKTEKRHWVIRFLNFFWPCPAARGILVPRPGIEPMPPALGVRNLNHWNAREVPWPDFYDDPKRGLRIGDFESEEAGVFPDSAIYKLWHLGKMMYFSANLVCSHQMGIITPKCWPKQRFSDMNYSLSLLSFSSEQIFSHFLFTVSIPLLQWKLHEGRDFSSFCSLWNLCRQVHSRAPYIFCLLWLECLSENAERLSALIPGLF